MFCFYFLLLIITRSLFCLVNMSEPPPQQPGLTLVVNYFQMMLQEREISPESDDISTVSSRDNITVMTTRSLGRSAALQRIGSQQDRWKQQVSRWLWWSAVVMSDVLDNLRSRSSGHGYTINTRCSTEESLLVLLTSYSHPADVNKPNHLI